ncbi:hypothetical protein ACFTWH_18665 [Streptomyces sp. NPDC057011]|uniref:hypothetical protein n=1 Tax=unclassified Streptomyces TaxID=2593676 RepID=UPI00363148E6
MNATDSSPATSAQVAGARDRSRFRAVLSAVLFVPAALAAGVLVLASEEASRCVTYGEQCAAGLPGWLFGWGAGIGAVAFVVALAAPAKGVRQVSLAVQVFAECTALLVILSYG